MPVEVTVDCNGVPVKMTFENAVDLRPDDVLDVSMAGEHFKAVCRRTGEEFLLVTKSPDQEQ